MLTGKQVRVRLVRNKLVPYYLNPNDPNWLGAADQLLLAFRSSVGHTRGEIDEEIAELTGDGPGQLVHQGLAKLLEDRCEFEMASDLPPDAVREVVFRLAAVQHKAGLGIDREAILTAAAAELDAAPALLEPALFADLKDEQRVLTFDDISAENLLHRYNVALAQAILLRSTGMEVRVWNESPARFRKLFRTVKFHRLIAAVRPAPGSSYIIQLDGPLSLFSSTQKYGLQLALFLPSLLHCKTFELTADVLWGAEKKPKAFALTATDGLKSHLPDFGVYTPREIATLIDNLRATVPKWTVSDDPDPQLLDGTTWIPDFTLTHNASGTEVFVEVLGFWRSVDIEAHYKKLKATLPGRFVLVVSEQYRADEAGEFATGPGVYRFKRTPVAAEVAKTAAAVAGLN